VGIETAAYVTQTGVAIHLTKQIALPG
jgi:hypothetical protein